ncbi:MAG: C39 family peptidase [bacterium]|nr:C39 family peptidase [bacterium]
MIKNFPLQSQNDERWKYTSLGTSKTTLGNYGCLITCISSLLTYFGISTQPDKYNEWLIKNNGYKDGNLYYWSSIGRYSANRVALYARHDVKGLNSSHRELIDQEIANGRPVVMQVDFYPTTDYPDMHWVVYLGDGLAMDPWNGKVEPLTKYGGERKVVSFIFHNGQVPKEVSMDLQQQLEKAQQDRDRNWDVGMNNCAFVLGDAFGIARPNGEYKQVLLEYANTVVTEVKKLKERKESLEHEVSELKSKEPNVVQPTNLEEALGLVGRLLDSQKGGSDYVSA